MRGRPKQEVTRSSKILIRLFPQEKKLICDIAKEYGMSISDFIRAALLNLNPDIIIKK